MPANSNKTRSVSHCQFPFSDGRRCALPVSPTHPHFCFTHALRERRLLGAERIAAELTAMSTQIRTANDLNHFLTRLVFYTASQQIPKSTARTLAYLASLLLQTLPAVKNEVTIAHGYQEWRELLRHSVPDSSDVPPYASSQESQEDAASAPPSGYEGGASYSTVASSSVPIPRSETDETQQTDDSVQDEEPVAVSG
jgi:hypothetical protein